MASNSRYDLPLSVHCKALVIPIPVRHGNFGPEFTLAVQVFCRGTSLDSSLYSSEPYSASSAVVEGSNCKLNWDIVTDIMPTTPLEPEWCAVHSTPSELLCNPGQCPVDGLTGPWGLTVKAQCLSSCPPPRHPIPSGSATDQW